MRTSISGCVLLLLLAGCAANRGVTSSGTAEFHPPRTILEAYDANHDGTVTRAEMERGLRADFDKADKNRTGCLDSGEVSALNEQRWERDRSTYSPLVDFEGRGCIDFDEFAATARSLFDQMDRNGDGKVTPEEFHPPHRPRPNNY